MKLVVRLATLLLLVGIDAGVFLYSHSLYAQVSNTIKAGQKVSRELTGLSSILDEHQARATLAELRGLENRIASLQRSTRTFRPLAHVSIAGTYLNETFQALDSSGHLVRGGRLALEAYVIVLGTGSSPSPPTSEKAGLAALKEKLESVEPGLREAQGEIREASRIRQQLSGRLPFVSQYLSQVDEALPLLNHYVELGLRAPAMLGDILSIEASFTKLEVLSRLSPAESLKEGRLGEALSNLQDLDLALSRLRGNPEEMLRLAMKLASVYNGGTPGDLDAYAMLDNALHLVRASQSVAEGAIPLVEAQRSPGPLCDTVKTARDAARKGERSFLQAREELEQFQPEVLASIGDTGFMPGLAKASKSASELARLLQATTLLGLAAERGIASVETLRCGPLYDALGVSIQDPVAGIWTLATAGEELGHVASAAKDLLGLLLDIKAPLQALGLGDAYQPLVDAADALATAVDGALGVQEAVSQEGFLSPAAGGKMASALEKARRGLSEASQVLPQLRRIVENPLAGPLPFLGALGGELDRLGQIIKRGEEGLDLFSNVMGFDGPRTILVLGQDESEIRATGGFIGGVAEVRLENGALSGLRSFKGHQVDGYPFKSGPLPPAPLYKYMWNAVWFFQDTNWSPHFPAAAETVAYSYWEAQGVWPDMILATDRWFLASFLDALGGAKLPEFTKTLPGNEALLYFGYYGPGYGPQYPEKYTYTCRPRHNSTAPEVCFLQDLLEFLLSGLRKGLGGEGGSQLSALVSKALDEKHVLVATKDESLAKVIRTQGWDGALVRGDGDFLAVIDSNLGINKVNQVVERRLRGRVSLSPSEGIYSDWDLEYKNSFPRGSAPCDQGVPWCYWNYLRVYIPREAKAISMPELLLPKESFMARAAHASFDTTSVTQGALAGLTEVAGLVLVPGEENGNVRVSYQLPWSLVQQVGEGHYIYRLHLHKQPGTAGDPFIITVEVPQGYSILRAGPGAAMPSQRVAIISGKLTTDLDFELEFRRQ
ncbi:MAG: DUF4012 domain-containing protein [Chloroflexi bacterium]|nr:DUF4012 domain-containing protein [Chloroflexota bacterium]